MRFWFLSLFLFVFAINLSCAQRQVNPNLSLMSVSDYKDTVQDNTQESKLYKGFYQTLGLSATLLNSQMSYALIDQNARIYQWDKEKYEKERAATTTDLGRRTQIFLSFFVPERKHDDLHKPKTLWKFFLDANGKRYEGTATKMKTIFAEVQSLYPHHNRWSTPYILSFPVPIQSIENSEIKLTLTGPVDSSTVTFKPITKARD